MAGVDGDFRQFATNGRDFGRFGAGVSLLGAATSVALVVSLGVWGYKLAVRDVSGIPVVRAIEGPARVAPEQPGGDIAVHQGLAVNEVAAVGTASQPADRLVLAPRPVDLAPDDMAGLGPLNVPDTNDVVAESVATALAPAPSEELIGTEDAIAMALAEALADEEGTALTDENLPDGVVASSPRPLARPGSAGMAGVEDVVAPGAAPIVELDPATLEPGTRLVQFGAYDTPDVARAEWIKLQDRFGDLMVNKAMVLEGASSGGRDFYRLRAHGFADEAEARRFCSAITTENAACIPVAHR